MGGLCLEGVKRVGVGPWDASWEPARVWWKRGMDREKEGKRCRVVRCRGGRFRERLCVREEKEGEKPARVGESQDGTQESARSTNLVGRLGTYFMILWRVYGMMNLRYRPSKKGGAG